MAVDRPHHPVPPVRSGVGRLRTRAGGPVHAGGRLRDRGRWGRVALAALLVASMTFGGSDGVPQADAGVAPACTYGEVLTHYRAERDWYRSLLDTKYRLSSTFAPNDLVSVGRAGVSGYGSIRRIALADLTAMYRAAKAAGAPFAVQSAYRSYSSQVATFWKWVREEGYYAALRSSARAGHSEHQLGTALDVKTPGGAAPWDYADWGQTKAGTWLRHNSWRYGWVMSYPKAKSPAASCYKYEPWHFRYVGRTIAAKIRTSTLAPREWLYLKGATSTWTGGLPNPAPTPSPSPSPTSSPSASPDDSPSTSPSSSPSDVPGVDPAATPSVPPTDEPTVVPTVAPTADPGQTQAATSSAPGTSDPSASPSEAAPAPPAP